MRDDMVRSENEINAALNLLSGFTMGSTTLIDAIEAVKEAQRMLDARAERLRLELEKIAWMDEFLDADSAKAMMKIARKAVEVDERMGYRCITGRQESPLK